MSSDGYQPASGDAGAPATAPPTAAEIDLAALLERRARVSPERPAVTFKGHTRTFNEVHERVRRLAQVLRDGAVQAGDRIAYLGMNHPAILETLFAAASLDAVLVPLNWRLAGPELARTQLHKH